MLLRCRRYIVVVVFAMFGFVAGCLSALKHIRDRDITEFLLMVSANLKAMDLTQRLTIDFIKTMFNYTIKFGNADNIEQLNEVGRQLPQPVRGEFMTAAETLRAWGEEQGIEKGIEKVAINSLKEGADPRFVGRITGLEMSIILKLKAQLEDQSKDK